MVYEKVKVVGTIPKKQPPPSGDGGGTPTPTPQEPRPPTTQNPAQVRAEEFTEEEAGKLQQCWEQKATSVSVEIEGWNSDAIGATEAILGINKDVDYANGYADPKIKNGTLSINVLIFPRGIANIVASMFGSSLQEKAFEQLTSFTLIHETFHVGQLKTIFAETGALPKPYEYWDLEVEAHFGAGKLWQGMYGQNAATPSLLPLGKTVNTDRKEKYDVIAARYKVLEKKKEDGTITSAEETEMEGLAADLKSPSYLPQGESNSWWDPNEIDLDCE